MGGRRKRFWWAMGALVLGLALSLVTFWPGNPRRIVLPDGSTLTLRSVSYGTNHYAPPAFLNFLRRQVPSSVASRLRVDRPQVLLSPVPQLITWWEWPGRAPDSEPLIFLMDDNGVLGPPALVSSVDAKRGRFTATWSCFPRRAQSLRLKVYKAPATRDPDFVAELRVANPARGSFPQWIPEPLLLSARRIDQIEFRLASFQIELARGKHGYRWCDSPQAWATLEFHITSGAHPYPHWRTDEVLLSDATGNQVRLPGEIQSVTDRHSQPQLPRREPAGSNHVVSFLWPLGLDEAAYRVRVEFVRQPEAAFPPEDILEVKAVPVPPAEGISLINVQSNLHDLDVRLLALVGEHATLPGREHDVFGQTTLEVDVPPLPDDLRFDVLQVKDDQGRLAEPMPGAGRQSYGLGIPEGALTVDLKLALTKRYVVEFLASPKVHWR